jgi:hypothetical protein
VGVRWSDTVEYDEGEAKGGGSVSRKGPRVGGTFRAAEKVGDPGLSPPLLCGGMVSSARDGRLSGAQSPKLVARYD